MINIIVGNMAQIIVTLIVVGVIMWLVNKYIPMDGAIKTILNVVVVVLVIIWLLQRLGLMGYINDIKI